jgi:hypothetical protein
MMLDHLILLIHTLIIVLPYQSLFKKTLSFAIVWKKEPLAEQSEAVKPIYYLDYGVPEPIRSAY